MHICEILDKSDICEDLFLIIKIKIIENMLNFEMCMYLCLEEENILGHNKNTYSIYFFHGICILL